MRVLLVEDDGLVAEVTQLQLQHLGMEVTAVATVREAADAGPSAAWDAVVVDWGLPDGDGAAVIRLLRERGVSAPVVVATGNGAQAALPEGSGPVTVLEKPYTVAQLSQAFSSLGVALPVR